MHQGYDQDTGKAVTLRIVGNILYNKICTLRRKLKAAVKLQRLRSSQVIVECYRMHHECILSLLEILETPSASIMVMGAAEMSLEMYLIGRGGAARTVPLDKRKSWMHDALMGLVYLHYDVHLMHRALSPATLYLTHNSTRMKLGDFSTAIKVASDDVHAVECTEYTAPYGIYCFLFGMTVIREARAGNWSPLSDVWSLGWVMQTLIKVFIQVLLGLI